MNKRELSKLQDGDGGLFSELVREHHRALLALATPIVGVSEAEEVVQVAWLKAYQAISKFEGRASMRTFIWTYIVYSIASN
jgi:RNA polymerase sigma-70 factor (ECF subfamily)